MDSGLGKRKIDLFVRYFTESGEDERADAAFFFLSAKTLDASVAKCYLISGGEEYKERGWVADE